jgi:uncharacterized membrane protein (UPF0127 family)
MPSFLKPLLKDAADAFLLRNERSGLPVATQLQTAFDPEARRTGLLKHDRLPPGTAMIIAPTNAIHTFFMRFAIDVAFVAKDGRILKIRPDMPAWRLSGAWGGYAVVEMAAGSFAATGTAPGDTLVLDRT